MTILAAMIVFITGCAGSKAHQVTVLPAPPGTSAKAAPMMSEGSRLAASQEWAGASQAFQGAVNAEPTLAEAHYNLAVCLDRLGEKAEAKKHYVTAANLAPGNKVIWDSPPLREAGFNYNLRQKSFLDPNPRGGF